MATIVRLDAPFARILLDGVQPLDPHQVVALVQTQMYCNLIQLNELRCIPTVYINRARKHLREARLDIDAKVRAGAWLQAVIEAADPLEVL